MRLQDGLMHQNAENHANQSQSLSEQGEMMLDYSEILLNIQKTHRQCHEALLKRDWHAAKDLAVVIQLQAATLENACLNKTGEDE